MRQKKKSKEERLKTYDEHMQGIESLHLEYSVYK